MSSPKTVLITGATGQQGGAIINALTGSGLRLVGMTRKLESPAALALKKKGVTLVQGDLDDPESLKKALAGAWGVFAVQNTWEAGVEKEEEQGKRVATLAKEAGVQHFVYSSVGSAHRATGIPHFENKWRIEQTVRALGFPSHVILRPVFFMENMVSAWFLNGDKIYSGLRPDTVLQMIAVRDIGVYGARAFTDAERLNRREIDLAGDALTMTEATRHIGAALGRPIEYVQLPMSEIRKNSEDFALMLEWFERVGYNADIPALEREFGVASTTFGAWAKTWAAGLRTA
ncbi:MAG TPA: NmrA/HSCARG family protein [Gemmatimonadales bacterium]|nr:NmrA/HSCARG family protein [Gemmatimonadales bacterium]